jgi:hypothetical protein
VIFVRTMIVFTLQAQRWGVISNVFLVVVYFLTLPRHLMYLGGDALRCIIYDSMFHTQH